jgi:hypothetical protein
MLMVPKAMLTTFSADDHHPYPNYHHSEPNSFAHYNVGDNNYFYPTCSDCHNNLYYHHKSDDDTNRNNDNKSCTAQSWCRR